MQNNPYSLGGGGIYDSKQQILSEISEEDENMLSGARSSMMLSVNNRESQLKKQKPERVTNLNSNDKSPAQ